MPTEKEAKAQWSKDFVEHLRMVHFSSVALCLVLIVLATTSRSKQIHDALKELGQVIAVRDSWDPERFCPWDEKREDFSSNLRVNVPPLNRVIPAGRLLSPFVRIVVTQHKGGKQYYFLKPPPVTCELPPELVKPRLETIADARLVWDLVRQSRLSSVTAFRVEGHAWISAANENSDWNASAMSAWIWGPGADGQLAHLDAAHNLLILETKERTVSVLLEPVQKPVIGDFDNRWPTVDSQDFNQAFPNLISIGSELENVNLSTLLSTLLAEANKADNSLEAFGMKLPTGDVWLWGIVLLVGGQVYLLLHLQALRGKELKDTDAGWDVPWIGIYESRSAQLWTWLSIFPLPIAATLAIGLRAVAGIQGRKLLYTGGVLIIAVVVEGLSRRVWRSLPRRSQAADASEKETADAAAQGN